MRITRGLRRALTGLLITLLLASGFGASAVVGRTYIVKRNYVVLHKNPNVVSEFKPKVRLYKGNRVRHLGSKSGWWRVIVRTNRYRRNVGVVGFVDPVFLAERNAK